MASIEQAQPVRPTTVVRFSLAERLAHWNHAITFLILLATGGALVVRGLGGLLGRDTLMLFGQVHRVAAVLFTVVTIPVLWIGARKASREWVRDSFRLDRDDRLFLVRFAKDFFGFKVTLPDQGRFNAGEKVNSVLQILGWPVMVITGWLLVFKESLPVALMRWVLPFHSFTALFLGAVVIGHIYLATLHPHARAGLSGMISGRVPAWWAKAHYRKWYDSLFSALIIAPMLLLMSASPALADCGADATSCKVCHEGEQQKPVNQAGAWHTQHAFGDFCASCHLGDSSAKEQAAAHAAMRPSVLADPKGSCAACHTDNWEALASEYEQEQEKGAATVDSGPSLPPPNSRNGLFLALNGFAFAGLIGLYWSFEKGPLARKAAPPPMAGGATDGAAALGNPLALRSWSPYWAGAGLGIVAILALWISGQPLGSSGAFMIISSALVKLTGSSLADSVYFKLVTPPQVTWQLLLVAGIPLGAFLSARWSGDFGVESVPEQWSRTFGGARWKRWLTIFLGGMILEFGASIAGGCTSGLAIAGSLQLAGGGFLFIAGLFATGIVTARLLYGRRY